MSLRGLLGRITLPARTCAVAQVRAYAREVLTGRYGAVCDEAILLASELVANAVRHSDSGRCAGGTVTLTLCAPDSGALRIEVADAGSATRTPQVRTDAGDDSEGGRGLFLVEAIAAKWGWHDHAAGRVTWCELAVPESGPVEVAIDPAVSESGYAEAVADPAEDAAGCAAPRAARGEAVPSAVPGCGSADSSGGGDVVSPS